MANVNVVTIKKDLSKLYHEYIDLYNQYADIAYKTELQNLKAGDRAPQKGGLKTDDLREKFNNQAYDIKTKALDIIDTNIDALKQEKTSAPSVDATNYITLLRTRNDITDRDIDDAINAYGDNYSALKAIQSIARDKNIRVDAYSPIDTLLAGLDEVKANVQRMSAYDAERSNGLATVMFDTTLDMSLPSDEWK